MAKEKKKIRLMSQSSIYILHGWSYSAEKWTPFAKELESKGFEINLLNIPGLTEKINRPWNIEDYTNWLYKKLEKDKDVVLIGHSNGGRIAMSFSIKYPDKVSMLILIDCAGVYHKDLFLRIKRAVFKKAAGIGKTLVPLEKARNLLYFLAREKDYKNASPNIKKTMVNLIESDKALKIDRISIPTIIIWGKKDGITPVSDGKALNEKIVNSKLYVIDRARHSPQFTHPQQVIDIILRQL